MSNLQNLPYRLNKLYTRYSRHKKKGNREGYLNTRIEIAQYDQEGYKYDAYTVQKTQMKLDIYREEAVPESTGIDLADTYRHLAILYENEGRKDNKAKDTHEKAAIEYETNNYPVSAAVEYEKAKNYYKAAELYEQEEMYEEAGDMYEAARDVDKAREMYSLVPEPSNDE